MLKRTGNLLFTAVKQWNADKAPRLGAALAFYTVFSVAPMLIIAIAIAGFVKGEDAARGAMKEQLQGLLGADGAAAVEDLVKHAAEPKQGHLATILGIVALIFGATGVFAQIKDALNTIWEVRVKPGNTWLGMIRDYALSFAMVVTIGFLLLVSLIVTSVLNAATEWLQNSWNVPTHLHGLDTLVSLLVITVLFAALFKVMPDVKMSWKDVWVGAAVTALLFTLGKFLIGLYLGHAAISSTYGAAGSLVVLMLWTYYSAQIFLFGAELTQVYACQHGSQCLPADNAERVTPNERVNQGLNRRKDDPK